ncbi:MAG: 16S rRNA (uracil(1498)-N(3))-methyltransferase [Pseudomonadales bacterium]|jgi:16S rRNA (uracil1498-N3)-methyltransferase|tara:strand:- start:728 stop:1474 length:747 start_codon:yes stop_codon:yes gene_type:complete
MHVPRVFIDTAIAVQATVKLDGAKHHHLRNVLRLKPADAVILFNGQGGEYAAQIDTITKQETCFTALTFNPVDREAPLYTCLLQGILKRDAMINALQRATELGVSKIIPIQTQHLSEKRAQLKGRWNAWRAVIEQSSEQCGRTQLPELAPLTAFADAVSAAQNSAFDLRLLAHVGASEAQPALATPPQRIALAIGPEGGFSDPEVTFARANGFIPYTLGSRILRAETAPAALLAHLQTRFGEFAEWQA